MRDKVKILYAASEFDNSTNTLKKVYGELKRLSWVELYVVGYDKYMPNNMDYHFNLQSIGDIFSPTSKYSILAIPDELKNYWTFIKALKPDLVLSDFNFPTVDLSLDLGYNTALFSNKIIVQSLFKKAHKQPLNVKNMFLNKVFNFSGYARYMMENVKDKIVYSHYFDMVKNFKKKPGYTYIRPYRKVFDIKQDKVICVISKFTPYILKWLSEQNNIILYTDAQLRQKGITIYPTNHPSYYKNICEASIVISDGNEMVLSDAYYAGKYSIILNSFNNMKTLDVHKLMNKNASVEFNTAEFYDSGSNIELDLTKTGDFIQKENRSVKSLTDYLKKRFGA